MAAASNHTENNVINALLRGQPFDQPGAIYIALHTSDPTDSGGNEVTIAQWPGYARQDAAQAGLIESGWLEPADGLTSNAKQVLFPVFDGVGPLNITHFSLWDAQTGGTMRVHCPLDNVRELKNGDVFVVNENRLIVQML